MPTLPLRNGIPLPDGLRRGGDLYQAVHCVEGLSLDVHQNCTWNCILIPHLFTFGKPVYVSRLT